MCAAQAGEEAAQNLRDNLVILNDQLGKLLDLVLQGSLTQPEYAHKKAQLVNDKKEIEMKLAAFAREGSKRFEPLIGFYNIAVLAGESAVSGNPEENLQIMRKIGSNFLLGGKKIKLKFNFPSEELRQLRERADVFGPNFNTSKIWRCSQDIARDYFAQHPEVTL